MRIIDWSSDVCSSDLTVLHQGVFDFVHAAGDVVQQHQGEVDRGGRPRQDTAEGEGGREGPDHHACHGVFLSCGKSAKKECNPSGLARSEEHTSELQSLMRISYAVFCLKKQTIKKKKT